MQAPLFMKGQYSADRGRMPQKESPLTPCLRIIARSACRLPVARRPIATPPHICICQNGPRADSDEFPPLPASPAGDQPAHLVAGVLAPPTLTVACQSIPRCVATTLPVLLQVNTEASEYAATCIDVAFDRNVPRLMEDVLRYIKFEELALAELTIVGVATGGIPGISIYRYCSAGRDCEI